MQSKLAAAIVFFGGCQPICARAGMSAGTANIIWSWGWFRLAGFEVITEASIRPDLGVSTRVVWELKHPQFGSTAIGFKPGT